MQYSRCKLSAEKKGEQLCFPILNSHENPVLRHNRYFDIATAQETREAMHVGRMMLPSDDQNQ